MRIVTLGRWIVLILGLVAAGRVGARNLTPDEAMTRAAQYASGPSMSRSSAVELKLAYTARTASNGQEAAYYVFNRGNGGFVIASGDDRLRPVLAITDSGTFEADNLPPALKWWLSQYEAEIAGYLATPVALTSASVESRSFDRYSSMEPISPLVTTKWNQGDPFNRKCPADTYNKGKTSVTGCVATAFAQVVNYYKYAKPKAGEKFSYTGPNANVNYTMPSSFDFANMLDEYHDGEFSTAEADAVAELMAACGASVAMKYSCVESGAVTSKVVNAAINYFGYDESSRGFARATVSTAEWEKILYNELDNGRPVIYSGTAVGGGHAFVCDGYSEDGYFHFNWGWGGSSDGYYVVSALNPTNQGIGSFEGGYNTNQSLYTLIVPGDKGSTIIPDYLINLVDNPTWSGARICMPWSNRSNATDSKFDVGLLLTSISGEAIEIVGKGSADIAPGFQFNEYFITPDYSGVTDGKYKLVCVWKKPVETEWKSMTPISGGYNYLNVTVSGGAATYSEGEQEIRYKLELTDFEQNDLFYQNSKNSFTASITNWGEDDFSGVVSYVVSNKANGSLSVPGVNSPTSMTVPAESTMDIAGTFNVSGYPAGNWVVAFYVENDQDKIEIGSKEITVLAGENTIMSNKGTMTSTSWIPELMFPGDKFEFEPLFMTNIVCTIKPSFAILEHGGNNIVFSSAMGQFQNLRANVHYTLGSEKVTITIPDNLAPGLYDAAFIDTYNTTELSLLSSRIVVAVPEEIDNVYYVPTSESEAKAMRLIKEMVDEVIVPETVNIEGNNYNVTEIAKDFIKGNKSIKTIILPSSVETIGNDAFRNASSIENVVMMSHSVVNPYPSLLFKGVSDNINIYVPSEAFGNYGSYKEVGNLYAAITDISTDKSVKLETGSSTTIEFTVTPGADYNADFTVESSDNNVAIASVSGTSIAITGVADGTAEITLLSAQPGVEPVIITVNVGEVTPPEPVNPSDPKFDINGDTEVNVSDVVSLVNLILNKTFDPVLHDLNNDKSVTVSDIVVLVNYILDGAGQKSEPSRSADAVEVPVSFDLAGSYTAMQTDLLVADGTRIEDVTLNPAIVRSHTLAYREIEPGRYRVMVYSPGNHAMNVEAGEPLFTLAVSGSDSVETEATMFVEAEVVPTGIDSIAAEAEIDSVIYFDLQGRRVSAEARGILIERTVYTDGTVVNRKISR